MKRYALVSVLIVFIISTATSQTVDLGSETLKFEPFIWSSETPVDCPFKQSEEFNEIKLLGLKSGYRCGDTWYPTWAANDTLYSPWTDGITKRPDGYTDITHSGAGPYGNRSGI